MLEILIHIPDFEFRVWLDIKSNQVKNNTHFKMGFAELRQVAKAKADYLDQDF